MNLSVGIVGLPNVGKSTLFNALVKKQVAQVASFPFTTIEPNVGVVAVPDDRLPVIAKLVGSEKTVPAQVKFIDIAGLIKDAHKGEGLGNKFLSHIREVDLICHVLREFEDKDVESVTGKIDASYDREIVETELMLADLQTLENQTEPKGINDKRESQRWEAIMRLKKGLQKGSKAAETLKDDKEKSLVKDLHLLTVKPVLYVLNVSEENLGNGLSRVAKEQVVVSAKIEAELASLSEDEQKEYLKTLGLDQSGLDRMVRKAYALLGLITFYSGNAKQTTAWSARQGTTASKAASIIHADFQKHFIKAEIVPYDVYVKAGGWEAARDQGKALIVGRDYEMKDGDVVEFKVGTK